MIVGRVEEGDVETLRPAGQKLQRASHIPSDHLGRFGPPPYLDVLSDEADGALIVLQEDHPARAAAERLDADRAGPGVGVQEDALPNARPEDVEQRLAHPV